MLEGSKMLLKGKSYMNKYETIEHMAIIAGFLPDEAEKAQKSLRLLKEHFLSGVLRPFPKAQFEMKAERAMEYLGCSRSTLYRLEKSGEISSRMLKAHGTSYNTSTDLDKIKMKRS